MPELPEVEAVRSSLEPLICGHKIVKVSVFHPSVIAPMVEEDFCNALLNRKITGILRRGKYLLLQINAMEKNGATDELMVHLRMTGQLVCQNTAEPLKKHTHIVLSLEQGKEIRFTDQRRFGKMAILQGGNHTVCKGLMALGPEPLSNDFNAKYLYEILQRKKVKIKAALLDQCIVAGLGNIYADEVLFASGILPERLCCSLSFIEVCSLCDRIKSILAEAILHKGTSFRDYVDGEGKKGGHQAFLKVYQRENEKCYKCGEKIRRVKIGGRSSHFCPHCQK